MPNYHYSQGITLTKDELNELRMKYPYKFLWFEECGYRPHYWQILYHANTNPETDRLCRFRHLVAGRRGGKTLSAAWEVIFYALHPEAFHRDAHGVESSAPLHIWVVTKDYPLGMAALLAIREVLNAAGLVHGKDYKENRGNRWFEFPNGTFLQFKTADEPEGLRGAGLDILWFDESAFIPSERAWEVVRPALADKLGLLITSSTPDGKNWFYDKFWSADVLADPAHGRVEYRSIDNPHFSSDEWEYLLETMHPMLFKQEFMASFDSMAGKELAGDWLHYYEAHELDRFRRPDGTFDLKVYIGVDPAISLADTADRFAITAVGITKDRHQAYLLEQWAGRIPFPEQVDLINSWFQRFRPDFIGIERTAYQAALAQQVSRLEGLPPVVPLWAKGKKFERILSMSPLFRIGKVLIRKDHNDFINEWVDYDSTKSNPKDDCLDSMEITLRTAGVLLPGSSPTITAPLLEGNAATTADTWSKVAAQRVASFGADQREMDLHFGDEW